MESQKNIFFSYFLLLFKVCTVWILVLQLVCNEFQAWANEDLPSFNSSRYKESYQVLKDHNNRVGFFNSIKYKDHAQKVKAIFCVTTENLKDLLPKNCRPIISKNVLLT